MHNCNLKEGSSETHSMKRKFTCACSIIAVIVVAWLQCWVLFWHSSLTAYQARRGLDQTRLGMNRVFLEAESEILSSLNDDDLPAPPPANQTGLIVNTEGCHIPDYSPWDGSLAGMVQVGTTPTCTNSSTFWLPDAISRQGYVLLLNRTALTYASPLAKWKCYACPLERLGDSAVRRISDSWDFLGETEESLSTCAVIKRQFVVTKWEYVNTVCIAPPVDEEERGGGSEYLDTYYVLSNTFAFAFEKPPLQRPEDKRRRTKRESDNAGERVSDDKEEKKGHTTRQSSRRATHSKYYHYGQAKKGTLGSPTGALNNGVLNKSKNSAENVEKHNFRNTDGGRQLSVLIIGLDSTSRLMSRRQYSRTRSFMLRRLGAVELFGYAKVGDNTFFNMVPLLTGHTPDELGWKETAEDGMPEVLDEWPFLWKDAKEMGYRTILGEDYPGVSAFNFIYGSFTEPPVDYYYRPAALHMELNERKWHNHHHCYGSRLEAAILLDYMTDSLNVTQKGPRFGLTFITRLSPHTGSADYSSDTLLRGFLERTHSTGLLDDTVVVLMSDHGVRGGPLHHTTIGKIENRMPLFMISFPAWFREKHAGSIATLKENAHRLTTHFDVYATLKQLITNDWDAPADEEIINAEKANKAPSTGTQKPTGAKHDIDIQSKSKESSLQTSRGSNLFLPISSSRTCKDAGIPQHWCPCEEFAPARLSPDLQCAFAKAIEAKVNSQLATVHDKCAYLTVLRIADVLGGKTWNGSSVPEKSLFGGNIVNRNNMTFGNQSNGGSDVDKALVVKRSFLVTVEMNPGGALLALTVIRDLGISDRGQRSKVRGQGQKEKNDYAGHHYKDRDRNGIEGDELIVLDELSRVNLYGNTSTCVSSPRLRLMCFCKSEVSRWQRAQKKGKGS